VGTLTSVWEGVARRERGGRGARGARGGREAWGACETCWACGADGAGGAGGAGGADGATEAATPGETVAATGIIGEAAGCGAAGEGGGAVVIAKPPADDAAPLPEMLPAVGDGRPGLPLSPAEDAEDEQRILSLPPVPTPSRALSSAIW